MNILIIGFQRSGTTLLRRLLQSHPQVDKIFHESFFLASCKTKQQLIQYVDQRGFNVVKGFWGEKVPYFPNLKNIPVVKYCNIWNSYFPNSRILHIIRHPYDCALSNVKKFKNIKSVGQPINLYKTSVPKALKAKKNVYTFKYEDMILNGDVVVPKIFKHCGLNPKVDYKKRMLAWKNPIYQKLDTSKVFQYKRVGVIWDYDLYSVIEEVNKIEGPKYEL